MSNTYTQIHIHAVFTVKNRQSLISTSFQERLYDYITAIVQNRGHKMLAIGGTKDHVHMLFGMRPEDRLSSIMLAVKRDSSKWLNEEELASGKFHWQSGYGAFSCSKSRIPKVIRYIQGQKQHHAKKTFREEYLEMLKRADIQYDERYLPDIV